MKGSLARLIAIIKFRTSIASAIGEEIEWIGGEGLKKAPDGSDTCSCSSIMDGGPHWKVNKVTYFVFVCNKERVGCRTLTGGSISFS